MTVSVSYLSKNCTTCLFISKSFKELFFKYFHFESGCKGKAYFWTTKTFWSFFSKKKVFFEVVGSKSSTLFSISTHLRFSLESGYKITALRHILQTSATLFSYFFAFLLLSHWYSKDAVEQIFKTFGLGRCSVLPYYLYARTYIQGISWNNLHFIHPKDKSQIHN